jgi:hypothetical protein
MRQRMLFATAACFSLLALSSPATAQPRTIADRPVVGSIEVASGLMDYDLSGTGKAMPVSIRATVPVTRRLDIQFGGTLAAPQQQFGGSLFVVPEAHIRYSWRLARVEPYVVGGGGFSVVRASGLGSRWEPTLSGGGGVRVPLSDRIYAVGEMRLRAIAENFSASTAEWLGGVGWKLWE